MRHVLLKLIVMQPEVLLTHLKNYADLAAEELHLAFAAWRLRVLLYAVSGVLLGLGVMCGLVAVLLWGALPELHPRHAWVLVALPWVLLALGMAVGLTARRQPRKPFFEDIQAQIELDRLALSEAPKP